MSLELMQRDSVFQKSSVLLWTAGERNERIALPSWWTIFLYLLFASDAMCWQPKLFAAPVVSWTNNSAVGSADEPLDYAKVVAILRAACAECHSNGADEGGFSLDPLLADRKSLQFKFREWQKIQQRMNDRSMPPADAESMKDSDRQETVTWIKKASVKALTKIPPKAGPPLLRRLSRHEYSNTVRDLLNVHFDAGQGLPEENSGGEGFTNASETLIISPIHAEKYLEAASNALDYAARNEATRKRLLIQLPKDSDSETAAARENLRLFSNRAFRRPVTEKELERFVGVFEAARHDGLAFEEAVFYAMRGIMISPSFLFIAESLPSQAGKAELVSDHELAARLSYFLWASMPDNSLRMVADRGKLNSKEQLRQVTLRLLKARGTRLQDSLEHFVGAWLGTGDLGRAKKIDRDRHRWIKDPHVAALRNQPVYYLESVIQQNESLLTLIDSDWTFLNNELMRVYRLDRKKINR